MVQLVKKSIWVPCLIILTMVQFYRPFFFPQGLFGGVKYLLFIAALLFFFTKGNNIFKVKTLLGNKIQWYAFLIALNCITCYLYRGQSIKLSLLSWESFFLMFFYPCFKSWDIPIHTWERVLERVFVILLCCYVLQYIFIDVEIFDLDSAFDYLEKETRVRIYSSGLLTLGCLYSWNKLLTAKRGKRKYLILFVVSLLMVFLQGFRMLIASLGLMIFIMFVRINRFKIKNYIAIAVILFVTYSIAISMPIVQNKVDEIINRNETANLDNDDYVRVLSFNYFTNEHFKNALEHILGSGLTFISVETSADGKSYIGKNIGSEYSKTMSQIAAWYHFYHVDWGLVGLTWVAGLPFTIFFIFILIYFARKKVGENYYYLGMWEYMVIISGLTNPISYYHHNIIYHALVFVIIDLAHNEYKAREEAKSLPCSGKEVLVKA